MTTGAFTTVPVAPLPFERFGEILDEKELAERLAVAARAAELLRGRAVWCVNSTATGGGVAEMLRSLLAYTRGAGVDTRWLVLGGDADFFLVTKRLHNRLHGASGDAEPLDDRARAAYDAITQPAGRELRALVSPGDVVILHDPQTAGLAPALRDAGVGVIWRSHIGVDDPDDGVREAWDFLRPGVEATAPAGVLAAAVHLGRAGPGARPDHPSVDRRLLGQEPGAGARGGGRHPARRRTR